MSLYTLRPLGPWTDHVTPAWQRRNRYTFKATWTDTEQLLVNEVEKLRGKQLVLQVDYREQDLRLDGRLRAGARTPEFPGVRVSFESKHGPLTYATDAHELWQHNVRGIALALQALRAVDRYGVTKRGEQYTGWKALPAGNGSQASHMTEDQARDILRKYAAGYGTTTTGAAPTWQAIARGARIGAHPDRRGGDHTASDEVLAAMAVLGLS